MKRLLLVLLLAALPVSSAGAETRILSGHPAPEDHFSSAVALVFKGSDMAYRGQFCGGVLVRPRWVLTAAHCTPGKMWKRTDVVLSRKNLALPGGQRLPVQGAIKHPRYEKNGSPSFDFALLRIPKGALAQPLRSWRRGAVPAGRTLFVGGWGETEWQTYPSEMREVRVRTFSRGLCQERYGPSRTVFCAGRTGGEFDACFGDSGGPIVSRHAGREKLWGLVSFGRGCGLSRWPGAYARVGSVVPWIRKVLSEKHRFSPRRAVRDRFPEELPVDLGPLRSFLIEEKKDWVVELEEHMFVVWVDERSDWPIRNVTLRIQSGRVCQWEECDLPVWQMDRRPDRSWFMYFYSSEPCPVIQARVQLRKKIFSYKEAYCK